jgi:2-polyprenyl-3-methyl-5-hydroxy-6-metoxy-1,4-benzoquinol methylase/LPS sulfotransferase NodH
MIPFVVVGMPRTGSTLLATGLDQHPDARCFGELFHPDDHQRAHAHALRIGDRQFCFDPSQDDAIGFLRTNLHAEGDAGPRAVGFKLLGDYVAGPGSERLYQRLKHEIPDLRVIHIVRSNYLDVLASRETARMTQQWVLLSGAPHERKDPEPFVIDPAAAARFFDHMQQMDRFHEAFFSTGRYIKVRYERLATEFQAAINECYAFLDLSPYPVQPSTIRQRANHTSVTVANYRQLAARFTGSNYAWFFDGDATSAIDGDLATLVEAAAARAECSTDLSVVLQDIPLDLFAWMQVHRDRLPERLQSRLPRLPAPAEQSTWAGGSGLPLMLQTADYVKLLVARYLCLRPRPLADIRFLDYGCGWGRVLRFMAALVRNANLHGVDPMRASLEICRRDGVPGTVTGCPSLPLHGVDLGIRFDLINCFSVFTHLAEQAHAVVLAALRGLIADDGLLFLSIRSRAYWHHRRTQLGDALVAQRRAEHDRTGFSFLRGPEGSELGADYGDASISLDYVRTRWTEWNLEAVEFSHHQPNQLILCLSPLSR